MPLIGSLLVAVVGSPASTTTTIGHAASRGRDWIDWTQYGAVIVAGVTGLVGVILAGVLLWRARPECQLGPARFIRSSGGRWTLAIDVHIVASGHWVLKDLDVVFRADGVQIDAERMDPTPPRGVGELRGQFVYEMDCPSSDIEVNATLTFRHGGKPAAYSSTLPARM